MKRIKLTRQEKAIEAALLRGEYADVSRTEFKEMARAIAARKKDAILHLRVNRQDLKSIKGIARHLGVKYQSFISELLHRVATQR